ncbi:MAG: tetratricopeptide repeat protein [bacterium]
MINPTLTSLEDYETTKQNFTRFLERYENQREISTIGELCKKSYFYLAQLAILQGDHTAAIAWYERALNIFSDDSNFKIEVYLALANSYQHILEFQLAAQAFQNALTQDSFNELLEKRSELMALPLYAARLEHVSVTKGRATDLYKNAEAYYKNIVREVPNSEKAFWARIQLATVYGDQGLWDHCLALLNEALTAYPNHQKTHEIQLLVGSIYSEVKQDYINANNYFEKAIKDSSNPDLQARAHLGKGYILFKQKKNEAARKKMHWIIENFPRNGRVGSLAQFAIARSYELEKRWDRAIVEYRWLMDTYPLYPEGLYTPVHVANHFKSIRDNELASTAYLEAVQRYHDLIAKYPQSQLSALAQEFLVLCYAQKEEWDLAIRTAERLYDDFKTNPNVVMGSQLLLAQLYENNSNKKAALKIYRQFLKKFPGHPLAEQIKNKILRLVKGGIKG